MHSLWLRFCCPVRRSGVCPDHFSLARWYMRPEQTGALTLDEIVEHHGINGGMVDLTAFSSPLARSHEPAITLLTDMEQGVIHHARFLTTDTIEGRAVQLESCAHECEPRGENIGPWRLADSFQAFVSEMTRTTGKEPEQGREPRERIETL